MLRKTSAVGYSEVSIQEMLDEAFDHKYNNGNWNWMRAPLLEGWYKSLSIPSHLLEPRTQPSIQEQITMRQRYGVAVLRDKKSSAAYTGG